MKKKILLPAAFCVLFAQSFAQNTNTLLPYGNVGIGTLLPTAKLQVNGSTLLQNLTVTGTSVFQQSALFNNELSVVGNTALQATKITGEFQLPNLTVQSTPSEGIQVVVRDPLTGTVAAVDISNFFFDPVFPSNPAPCGIQDATLSRWSGGPYKIFNRCPQTKVGIGTDNPVYHLTVMGRVYGSEGLRVGEYVTSNSTPAQTALIEGEQNVTASKPLLKLGARNANGTSETRFKVEANGTLFCTEVRVRPASAIPDYVFKPAYQLMPLNELKDYVETNSHLPNIPSEAEIQANGMAMAEFELKLLEKVEELTLYMISLNEKNEELAAQNAKLMNEIEALKTQIKH